MTRSDFQTMDDARNPGTIRRVFATGAAVALIAFGGAAGAFASGGGGVGTGGGGGSDGGDGGGSRTGERFDQAWDSFSEKDKRWAHKTSECESGGDPKIHSPGGTYHGAFQFSTATWKSSPMSPGGRHADNYSWKVQAVVAVKLKHRDSAGHWPVCG